MTDALAALLAAAVPRPSPNCDARRAPVREIVLHYTGMPTAEAALARLTDPAAKVSAHFVIDEDGTLYRLVPPEKRAWHAGVSFWRGRGDINSSSVGIELVNPGHEWGYRPFPEAQMARCVALVAALVDRFGVAPRDVIGHSDVAPARKDDPGELFDWPRLARRGLALARPAVLRPDPGWSDGEMLAALAAFGYDVAAPGAAIRAFARHFRPDRVTDAPDAELRAVLATLLAEQGISGM